MIAGGVLLFIVESVFSGAWLAFLGWFLLALAGSEARYLAVRDEGRPGRGGKSRKIHKAVR